MWNSQLLSQEAALLRKPLADERFQQLLKRLPPLDLERGPYIAGGCARKLWTGQKWDEGDVDIFFRDPLQRQTYTEKFENNWGISQGKRGDLLTDLFSSRSSSHLNMDTENAATYHLDFKKSVLKLQLIKTRYSNSVTDLWKDFDFSISCFACDHREIIALPAAVDSAVSQRLTVNNPDFSKNLALRVLKYTVYGFSADDDILRQAADGIENGDHQCDRSY